MKNQIEKISQYIPTKEKTSTIGEIKELPESTQKLFNNLNLELKEKIFSSIDNPKKEKSLEEIIANFSQEQKEEFSTLMLFDLIRAAKFNNYFQELDNENLEKEIKRLVTLLWENRTKKEDNIIIFSQKYYDEFWKKRNELNEKIKKLNEEIKKQEESIEKTKKQKRLSEKKKHELKNLIYQRNSIKTERNILDDENQNTFIDYTEGKSVKTREIKEKNATLGIALINKYISPEDFLILLSESLEIYLRWNNLKYDQNKKDQIHQKKEIISNTINTWYEEHSNDKIIAESKSEKQQKKEEKIIEHLQSLIASYKRAKENNREENDLIYTIRQMEVILTILGKS